MMGANWQIGPRCTVTKKFAWWPVRTESGKLVWCRKYVNVRQSVSGPGSDAVWNDRYTENEYLIATIKNEI
jgi:hypothetical protein